MCADYIKVGKIVNIHGVRGCVKCVPLTDEIERFDELEYIVTEKDNIKRNIQGVWYKKGMVYLTLEGITTVDEATAFRDTYISITEEQKRILPEDTYYIFDLEGLEVYSTKGEHLGYIKAVYQTGANDVYEVKNGEKTYLIPAIKEVVREVDIENGRAVINVIEGLLE